MNRLYQANFIEVGMRVKELQNRSRIKNKNMAELLNITIDKYKKICSGKVALGIDEAFILHRFFHVSISWIFYGREDYEINQNLIKEIKSGYPVDYTIALDYAMIRIAELSGKDLLVAYHELSDRQCTLVGLISQINKEM